MNKYLSALCVLMLTMILGCKKDVKTIISETKEASFVIYTFDEYGSPSGSGSGFFIDSKGTGITNYHVLDGAVKAILKMNDSTEVEIDKVLASDEKWDIVKFSVKNPESKKFKYLSFADKMPEQGDKVYNISAPMGLEQTVSDGLVSSIRKDSHGDIIQITAPISPGSSGSALLNEDGDVIAVASFFKQGGQNLNFGVVINKDKLASLTDNPFEKKNKSFNSKENFIILNIPEEHNGYKVTKIDDKAFEDADWLKAIRIPNTIEYIGENVFHNTGFEFEDNRLYVGQLDKLSVLESDKAIWPVFKGYYNEFLNNLDNYYSNIWLVEYNDSSKSIIIKEETFGISRNVFNNTALEELTLNEDIKKFINIFPTIFNKFF